MKNPIQDLNLKKEDYEKMVDMTTPYASLFHI